MAFSIVGWHNNNSDVRLWYMARSYCIKRYNTQNQPKCLLYLCACDYFFSSFLFYSFLHVYSFVVGVIFLFPLFHSVCSILYGVRFAYITLFVFIVCEFVLLDYISLYLRWCWIFSRWWQTLSEASFVRG